MHLTIRPRDRQDKLNRSLLASIEQRFAKLDRFIPESGNVDIQLEHIQSRRHGKTHYVHATATIPGEPTTLYVEALAENFRTACDRVYEKLERQLTRHHDRVVRQRRRNDQKESVRTWLHETLSKPRRLLDRLKRRRG